MKPRQFTSIMPIYHHEWSAEALGMAVNPGNGPDLIDEDKLVELKFAIINPKNPSTPRYPKAWTVDERQMQYPEDWQRTGYWGLGFYELSKAIRSIDAIDMWNLEALVISRELHIVQWSWMNQFPPHHTQGKGKTKEWDTYLRYPKFNQVSEPTTTYGVSKGTVHLTENIPESQFQPGKLTDVTPF